MSAFFLELARTSLFLSSSPYTFRLRMISLMVVLAPHGGVAKTLPVLRFATHKLIVFVDTVVGVEFPATTLAGKHMATFLPNFVLARHLQRLESFATDITGVNPFCRLCYVPPHWSHPATTWFPSQTCPWHLQWQSWSFGVPTT